MPSWDDDELWDDRDEPVRRTRAPSEEEPEPAADLVPLEPELEGSIYRITDKLPGIKARGRDQHPGLCVRCDVSARIACMSLGRDAQSPWAVAGATLPVEPSESNGLTKCTAFDLAPWTMRLPVLRLIHMEEGPIGRLEADLFTRIRTHIDRITQGRPGGRR